GRSAIFKDYLRIGYARDQGKGREDGVSGKVWDDPEPCEESRPVVLEPHGFQPFEQRVPLKINSHEGQPAGDPQVGFLQALALPLQCCWAVDLEHAQSLARIWIAQPEVIKASSQHYDLSHTAIDGMCKALFRETAASHYEQPKAIRMLLYKARYSARVFAADWDREGVAKD